MPWGKPSILGMSIALGGDFLLTFNRWWAIGLPSLVFGFANLVCFGRTPGCFSEEFGVRTCLPARLGDLLACCSWFFAFFFTAISDVFSFTSFVAPDASSVPRPKVTARHKEAKIVRTMFRRLMVPRFKF